MKEGYNDYITNDDNYGFIEGFHDYIDGLKVANDDNWGFIDGWHGGF